MYAIEQLIDIAAEKLGMDAFDLRLLNVPKLSDLPLRTATRLKLRDMDVYECLTQLRERIDWDSNRGGRRTKDGKLRGVGMGVGGDRGDTHLSPSRWPLAALSSKTRGCSPCCVDSRRGYRS